jgi:hypothetical protein
MTDTPALVSGNSNIGAGEAIPALIVAAGEQAVEQYRAYFDDAIRNPNTRKLYGQQARRFFRWASDRLFDNPPSS